MSTTKVIYTINKKTTEIELESGRTLLDGALINKLDPPFSCLEGVCASCEALVKEGEVEERVKTCQTFPKSSFVTVNYDLD
ncbi:MAG: 2Fe-2S iron-sulfur cluster binding domain-containing protein [Bdellovibrionota bacterium]